MASVYFDPAVLRHRTGPYHPETAERVVACVEALRIGGAEIKRPEPTEGALQAIERVHSAGYVERLRRACQAAPVAAGGEPHTLFDSPDNPISEGTFESAIRATGLALDAAGAVLTGRERSVFVATRPPGHHALASRAMGFCFFNTIAVAARYLVERWGLERVLVADFDVHHGNGTQAIFWEDGRVAYLSVHRFPFYPGSGAADEMGSGAGRGATVNVPDAAGGEDAAYVAGFENALYGLAERLKPEFVLVSAGFDAHGEDPLGGMRVTTEGFGRMTRALTDVALAFSGGRIVSLLEGGYNPAALGEAALAHVEALPEGVTGSTGSAPIDSAPEGP